MQAKACGVLACIANNDAAAEDAEEGCAPGCEAIVAARGLAGLVVAMETLKADSEQLLEVPEACLAGAVDGTLVVGWLLCLMGAGCCAQLFSLIGLIGFEVIESHEQIIATGESHKGGVMPVCAQPPVRR